MAPIVRWSLVKRILFVDDEPNILEGLRDLLRKYRRQMTMVFAPGGESALEELRRSPFDVVVSDMRMPGMDGATLLQKVKDQYPDIIRIILSGHAERDAVFKALPVCHQFLAKPCDPETLCNVIERSYRLRAVLTDESLRKQIGAIEKLPSLPKVYQQLMDVMSQPNVSTATIAEIIEQDSAMSAKILQLVNSACFGSAKSISRIDRAVVYLGMELVKNLALTVHVFTTLAERSVESSFESLQEHAIHTARVARRLLPAEQQAQQAFTAALLHDVGHLVLAICNPGRYRMILETCQSTQRPLHEVESEVLGVTHAAVGAYLLGLWGLPYPIVEAVAYHHDPATAGERTFDVVSAIAVADSLVDSLTGSAASVVDHTYLQNLNVLGELPRWSNIAKQELTA
jgi:HD-like signal output (HDOD) protein